MRIDEHPPYCTHTRTCANERFTENRRQPSSSASKGMANRCLIPFDRREGLTTAQAARVAGRTERRVRQWCVEHDLGRRVAGGPWLVSRVALDMFLNGDINALQAYLTGDRHSAVVVHYYEEAGLRELTERWQHIPA